MLIFIICEYKSTPRWCEILFIHWEHDLGLFCVFGLAQLDFSMCGRSGPEVIRLTPKMKKGYSPTGAHQPCLSIKPRACFGYVSTLRPGSLKTIHSENKHEIKFLFRPVPQKKIVAGLKEETNS